MYATVSVKFNIPNSPFFENKFDPIIISQDFSRLPRWTVNLCGGWIKKNTKNIYIYKMKNNDNGGKQKSQTKKSKKIIQITKKYETIRERNETKQTIRGRERKEKKRNETKRERER